MERMLFPVGLMLFVGVVFFRDDPPPPTRVAATAPIAAPPVASMTPTPIPPPVETAAQPNPAPISSGGEVTLVRAPDGHFYTDAMVNGSTVRFLVDTGATTVALTRGDADRIGLGASDDAFTATAMGAGGAIAVRPVMLDRVAVGRFEASGVAGAVVKDGLGISLLGQSYLSRIAKVTIEGDRMVLR